MPNPNSKINTTSTDSSQKKQTIPIAWQWVTFPKLGSANCYKVLQLRARVFIEEQNYAFNDLDDRDQNAVHLLGFKLPETGKKTGSKADLELVAYSRLMWPDKSEQSLELGRVIVAKPYRKSGVGGQILNEVVKKVDNEYPNFAIKITINAGDESISNFYRKVGFEMLNGGEIIHNPPHYKFQNFDFPCREMKRPPKVIEIKEEDKSFFKKAKQFSQHFFGRKASHTPTWPGDTKQHVFCLPRACK